MTFWGMGALAFGALAVLSASLSAVLPQSLWVGLHANRLEGGSLNQLRAEVTRLRDQQLQMHRQATQLRSRLAMTERNRGEMVQRVGALESSIPMLLEVVPPGVEIDRSTFTASIGEPENETISFEAEGGSVTLSQRPMFESAVPEIPVVQPLPQPLSSMEGPSETAEPSISTDSATGDSMSPKNLSATLQQGGADKILPMEFASEGRAELMQTEFGISIGKAVTPENAEAQWADLSNKIGTLLLGLTPAVSDPLGDGSNHIVLGPIKDYSEAEMLCLRITRVGIECLPVQFENSRRLNVR